MKYDIVNRYSGAVLFSAEIDAAADAPESVLKRLAVLAALKAGANLSYADLSYADLSGANLSYADLSGANLSRAYLSGADLIRANLSRANLIDANLSGAYLIDADLSSADLSGAYLSGAYLSRANLSGTNLIGAYLNNKEKLVGYRPIFQIGPIGSRCDYFVAYITDKGLRFDAGCQRQITREVFESRLTKLHGENKHAREYRAALALIDVHAEIWTPKEDAHVIGADPGGTKNENHRSGCGADCPAWNRRDA